MAGAVIRGDREINEVKLKNALGASEIRLATPEEILEKPARLSDLPAD